MDTIKKNSTTILIILATIILAGVAIFTAVRLYQLRQSSVSPTYPESQPKAWDCEKYNFSVDKFGNVQVTNTSGSAVNPQQAKVYINNQLVQTLDVPLVEPGQVVNLGKVSVPKEGFDWRVEGTVECLDFGHIEGLKTSCEALTFTISTSIPTPTPTPTGTPSPTPTGTLTPTPTPTPTSTPSATSTPTPTSTSTPTPTKTLAQASPTPTLTPVGAALPEAGISLPTILLVGIGLVLVFWAVLLVV